jgi:hypothetical protein
MQELVAVHAEELVSELEARAADAAAAGGDSDMNEDRMQPQRRYGRPGECVRRVSVCVSSINRDTP